MGSESTSCRYVYEALEPLDVSSDLFPDTSESCTVLRNEITTADVLAVDIPVADYISLDFFGESPLRHLNESPSVPLSAATTAARSPEASVAGAGATESAWFGSGNRFKSPMIQLHKEILDFTEFVSPTPEEHVKRNTAVKRVFEVAKYIWPHCLVEVFGSFKTGLYLPTSDIDVVILNSKVKTPQIGLYALARALTQRGVAIRIQVIAKARVPIIKFIEKQSGIAFDLSFDVDNGPKAADYIKNIMAKIPPLRPLCLILKVFLLQRELNEVYSGGIGSYALLSMLIAQLQIHWRSQVIQGDRKPSMEHNLGILLINFFDFYGRKLNTSDVGVSCNSTSNFFLKNVKGFSNAERPYLLSIEDPQAPDNDIGKSSFNYHKVRSAFAMAYSSLTDVRAIISLGERRSILGTIIRPDPVLLDRKGGCNGELTFQNLLPGVNEPVWRQFGAEGDDVYNWQVMDEGFPRGNIVVEEEKKTQPSRKRATAKKYESSKSEKVRISHTSKKNCHSRETIRLKRRIFHEADSQGTRGRFGQIGQMYTS